MSAVVTAGVMCVVGVLLVSAARATWGHDASATLSTVRHLRWWHAAAVPVLSAVLAAAWMLAQVPGLWVGWWSVLGGEGNPAIGRTTYTGVGWTVAAVVLPVLLALGVPALALAEERGYRLGAEDWSWRRRARKCLAFGLVHCVVGLPLAVGLALAILGAYLTAVYLAAYRTAWTRSAHATVVVGSSAFATDDGPVGALVRRQYARHVALHAATAAHCAYNWTLLGLIAVIAAVWGLG